MFGLCYRAWLWTKIICLHADGRKLKTSARNPNCTHAINPQFYIAIYSIFLSFIMYKIYRTFEYRQRTLHFSLSVYPIRIHPHSNKAPKNA